MNVQGIGLHLLLEKKGPELLLNCESVRCGELSKSPVHKGLRTAFTSLHLAYERVFVRFLCWATRPMLSSRSPKKSKKEIGWALVQFKTVLRPVPNRSVVFLCFQKVSEHQHKEVFRLKWLNWKQNFSPLTQEFSPSLVKRKHSSVSNVLVTQWTNWRLLCVVFPTWNFLFCSV